MASHRPRAAVLGAGSWGTALAALASANADTLIWARDPAVSSAIATTHGNPRYLEGVTLPDQLGASSDLDAALAHVDTPEPALIILGVPVAGLESLCKELATRLPRYGAGPLALVWTCKGFHPESGQLPHEIVHDLLGHHKNIGLGVLSGPSFAREVAQGLPVALTVASSDALTIELGTQCLHGNTARIYASGDIVGVEVGGAMKNIIAIACGISDGLSLGTNARAALITRGLAEIRRLGVALGGQPDTFYGLTGLGDLVLTATGELSRNRQVGLAIAQGATLQAILSRGMTAEGVRCAQATLALGRLHKLELPITEAVCQVLFEGQAPEQAVIELLAREARPE